MGHRSTCTGVKAGQPCLPRRDPSDLPAQQGWRLQGWVSGWIQEPSELSGLQREWGDSGNDLEWLRLGLGVGQSTRGEVKIQESKTPKRGCSPLHFTAERCRQTVTGQEAGPAERSGVPARRGPARSLPHRLHPHGGCVRGPGARCRAPRAAGSPLPLGHPAALSSSPSRREAPTPSLRSSRTRSGPGRARAARARGAAPAPAPAASAPPRR